MFDPSVASQYYNILPVASVCGVSLCCNILQISDSIRGGDRSDHAESLSLLKALYITCFAAAIGGGLFLMATFYVRNDWHQVELYIIEHRTNKLTNSLVTASGASSEEDDPLVHSDYEQPSVNT